MTNFVRASNPIWWIPDLTGFPLNDEYYAFFLTNDLPYVPQAVYQDPNGISPWSDPLQFEPAGTLPNNLYFDETKTYRIEIRHGNTSADELIYLIENFSPGSGNNVPPDGTSIFDSDNMITNPQFADIYFVSPFIYTQGTIGNYSINIGPGWRLDLVGSGTVTITQTAFQGSSNTSGNPNYYLEINSSGSWTSVKLVQRFLNNGALFGAGAIAVSFTARASGAEPNLIVQYVPSGGTSSPDIFSGPIAVGTFKEYRDAINLDPSTNPNLSGIAYVDIVFTLPPVSDIALTNIQIVGQTEKISGISSSDAPSFRQETYERTVDHEFHVYKESLLRQPKENLLVGWNFPLNPWQFTNPIIGNVANPTIATNSYMADQTIFVQRNIVIGSTGNNIAAGQATLVTDNNALQINAITPTNQFAIIQYIDASTIRPYWGKILSCLVNARTISASPTTKFKVRLIYRSNIPPTTGANVPIATWAVANTPVFSAGWSEIIPPNDPEYTLSALYQNFPFEKFQMPAATTNTMYLGIVIYTTTALTVADSIIFNNVSLVHNDFAIEASTETFDETLRKCQFYFEKSYDVEKLAATTTFSNAPDGISDGSANIRIMDRPFKVEKRIIPAITWYQPNNTPTPVANTIWNLNTAAVMSVSSTADVGKTATGNPITTGAGSPPVQGNFLTGHWTADARL